MARYGRKRGNPLVSLGIILVAAVLIFIFDRPNIGELVDETRSLTSGKSSYTYVLNTNTMRIHQPDCSSVYEMANHNRSYTDKSIEELQAEGYVKCKRCFGG